MLQLLSRIYSGLEIANPNWTNQLSYSCFIIPVLVVLIKKASLQASVSGVIGGSVVLQFSSTKHNLQLQDINIHWRHNGSEVVWDITEGEDSVQEQNQRYKNRVESFPDQYNSGNGSIKINKLQYSDAGIYTCYITHSEHYKKETVQLTVNESTTEKGKLQNTGPLTGTSLPLFKVYTVLPLAIILLVSVLCYLYALPN